MSKEKIIKTVKKIIVPVLVLIIISLTGMFTDLFKGFEPLIDINIGMLLRVLAVIALFMVLYYVFSFILDALSGKSGRLGTIITLLASVIKYVLVLVCIFWVVNILGVDIGTIFASLGIVALIIGFGAESLVADMVTGLFILFENEYNVGDIIEVDGYRGTVTEISLRTLSLRDSGGNVKIINNSDLKNIINRSNQRSVAVVDIGVSYDTDLEKMDVVMEEILSGIKEAHPDVFRYDMTYAGVESLGDYSITLRVVAQVEEEDLFSSKRLLNKELKIAFDKRGIVIPYPRFDMYSLR